MRQGRGSEATELIVLPFEQKSLFIPGCVQGAIIYFVCLSVFYDWSKVSIPSTHLESSLRSL